MGSLLLLAGRRHPHITGTLGLEYVRRRVRAPATAGADACRRHMCR